VYSVHTGCTRRNSSLQYLKQITVIIFPQFERYEKNDEINIFQAVKMPKMKE